METTWPVGAIPISKNQDGTPLCTCGEEMEHRGENLWRCSVQGPLADRLNVMLKDFIEKIEQEATMSEVQRETTIEKVKLPTTTVVEGEPDQPNEVAPEPQPEPDQGNSDDPKDRYLGRY